MDPQAGTIVHEPRARALFEAVLAAYPGWLRGRVSDIAGKAHLADKALDDAVRRSVEWLHGALAGLLAADPEEQRENPLHVLRTASRHINDLLANMGVATPGRDEFERRAMPEDTYAIGPVAWIDLGQEVHDAGIEWGAWKAAVIISRRKQAAGDV